MIYAIPVTQKEPCRSLVPVLCAELTMLSSLCALHRGHNSSDVQPTGEGKCQLTQVDAHLLVTHTTDKS